MILEVLLFAFPARRMDLELASHLILVTLFPLLSHPFPPTLLYFQRDILLKIVKAFIFRSL